MAAGTRKVSGSGAEGKKNGFEFRARNELTTKRKSRKGEGRYRAGEPHSLMTREARGARGKMISTCSHRVAMIILLLCRVALSSTVSRRFFRDDISRDFASSLLLILPTFYSVPAPPLPPCPLVPFGILGVNVCSFLPFGPRSA